MRPFNVALVGNPNSGKTTVFNALTGENQHVGNWPGKTVEMKTGTFSYQGYQFDIIDLPGIYSLSSLSPEEEITRDYIARQDPDVVVNLVDASNLERNLYLTIQLIEMNAPLIVMLNMNDIALRHGLKLDTSKLSTKLGNIPVLEATASNGIGLIELKSALLDLCVHKESETL